MLSIKNLKIEYGNNIVLENFNCSIKGNKILVILGPSGCGKSTLLYGISGLINPSEGEISLNEKILFSKKHNINILAEKRKVGFVFQDYSLWPHMTVFQNIAYPLKVARKDKKRTYNSVRELLDIVKLSHKINSYPSQLSGGEKQRVAIARAVASKPLLMLLDEPLANIDASLKSQMLNLIEEVNEELRIPMVYVTHDQKEAFEIADKIIVMDKGKISQEGSPREIYNFPKNKFTAKFIGNNNMMKCCHLNCNKFSYNSEDLLVVRPENIIISDKGSYTGEIKKITYKGHCYSLKISFKGNLIIANVKYSNYKVGDLIRFDFENIHVLSEGGDN
jgi:ABC-type sugar transport system ATPase subunit